MFAPDTVSAFQNVAAQATPLFDRAARLLPILTPIVALFTYWLGTRKRERDRRYEFYRDCVITPSMESLNSFFEKYRKKFSDHAENPPAATGALTVPRPTTKLHREFSQDLYQFRDEIVGRIDAFDIETTGRIDSAVQGFDTQATVWLFAKEHKEKGLNSDLILTPKRAIVRLIYKCNLDVLK